MLALSTVQGAIETGKVVPTVHEQSARDNTNYQLHAHDGAALVSGTTGTVLEICDHTLEMYWFIDLLIYCRIDGLIY